MQSFVPDPSKLRTPYNRDFFTPDSRGGLVYDQHGHEDKSKNALVLESDSCSIKVLFNNTSSQIHAEEYDVEGTR
jgi:hypothetical protein